MTKQQLAAKIWGIVNELRRNIKASEYKDYIIGFMFYRFLSVKEEEYIKTEFLMDDPSEAFEDMDDADKNMIRDHIGYFIDKDDLFSTWKQKGIHFGAADVTSAIDNFDHNTQENYRAFFKGIFDTLRNGLSKLSENAGSRDKAVRDIVDLVDGIPATSKDYDVLGYIYEYLIEQFSSEAKRDGAFYSPHELCECISKYIAYRMQDRAEITVYDPTVGSGGLLLTLGKEVSRYMDKDSIKYWGQELISETANLTKMNLFMQGIPVQNICVRNGNTLEKDWPFFDEAHSYQPLFVDAVCSNPPYSARWEPHGNLDMSQDPRFRNYGIAPEGKADFAFLLHCLYHLKPNGVMGIVLPHGVLFRGGAEGEIRKNLIKNNNIEAIVGYPSGLFFATGIPVVTIFLSKGRKESDILFIDASQSFKKDKKQNVLRKSDVQRIFDALKDRKDIPGFARLVSKEEIEKNDYNLNIPRYVSAAKEDTGYDLYSVMTGHISESDLSQFDNFFGHVLNVSDVAVEDERGYYELLPEKELRKTVEKKCSSLTAVMNGLSEGVRHEMIEKLVRNTPDVSIYHDLTESILDRYDGSNIVDKYKVFEAFVSKWQDIENDLSRIKDEGKIICKETEPNLISKKDPKTKSTMEIPDGEKGKIFPLLLIISTYFANDLTAISDLERLAENGDARVTEVWESIDEEERERFLKDDPEDGTYDLKKLKAYCKDSEADKELREKAAEIIMYLDLSKMKRKEKKEKEKEIDKKAVEKIHMLTDEEVEELLIKKWIDPVITEINGMTAATINDFVSGLLALEKKYENPMSKVDKEVSETTKEFTKMCGELVGSDTDMKAIEMLVEGIA